MKSLCICVLTPLFFYSSGRQATAVDKNNAQTEEVGVSSIGQYEVKKK
jgi:hypothetical protein